MDWPGRIVENSSYSTSYSASCSFRMLLWWLFGLKRPNKLLSNFPNPIPISHSAFCSMLNIISSDWNDAEYLFSFWTVPRLSLIFVLFLLHSNSIPSLVNPPICFNILCTVQFSLYIGISSSLNTQLSLLLSIFLLILHTQHLGLLPIFILLGKPIYTFKTADKDLTKKLPHFLNVVLHCRGLVQNFQVR